METLKIILIAGPCMFVTVSLLMGYGELKLRIGKKEKPILTINLGDSEETKKDKQ